MKKPRKAIHIDSAARTVRPLDVDGLKDMQAAVGGYIEAVTLADGHTLYVDEEGLLKGLRTGFLFMGRQYMGNGLILGPVKNADDTDCKLSRSFVAEHTMFGEAP